MLICVLTVVGALLSNALVAYGFSRIEWRGRDALFVVVLALLMLPFQVTMVPLFLLFSRIVSKILGGQLLRDISAFVAALDTMFGGFRERATATYELLRKPGTSFVVVASPEPDALREASYFVDRLSAEGMPLAGLVLNRTHPPASSALSATRAEAAAEEVAEARAAALRAAEAVGATLRS